MQDIGFHNNITVESINDMLKSVTRTDDIKSWKGNCLELIYNTLFFL